MLQLGQSSYLSHRIDSDSYERIVLGSCAIPAVMTLGRFGCSSAGRDLQRFLQISSLGRHWRLNLRCIFLMRCEMISSTSTIWRVKSRRRVREWDSFLHPSLYIFPFMNTLLPAHLDGLYINIMLPEDMHDAFIALHDHILPVLHSNCSCCKRK